MATPTSDSDQQQEEDEEQRRRRFAFKICKTKAELHDWVVVYLGLDLPDSIVYPGFDASPSSASNSSPMDMVWDVYSKMLEGTDESFQRVLYYASRDSFKTLGAAVIEILAILHCNRSAAHMAAISEQALKSQEYVKRAFRRPWLRDFVVGNNERTTKIVRYYNRDTQHSLTLGEYEQLTEDEKEKHEEIKKTVSGYVERETYVKIIICTMQGANCIDPGMTITMADGSRRLAMDVNIGDNVKVFDTIAREWTVAPVSEKGLTVKPAIRLSFDGGGSVVVSDDHQVFTDSGWVQARALSVGTVCFDASGENIRPTSSEGFCLNVHEKPSNLRSVLIGTMLGDASMTWPKNKKGERYGQGPRISFSHCADQKQYLEHKVKLLSRGGLSFSVCRDGDQWKATSGVCSSLARFFEMFYGSGRKKITKEILDLVDDEALAFWLMDDGSGSAKDVGSRKEKHLSIATCCFSREENLLAVEKLRSMGIDSSVGSVRNAQKTYPTINISLNSSRELSRRLSVYFHHDLKYKLPAPVSALTTKCIDCDVSIPLVQRGRFDRCVRCRHPNTRKERARAAEFKKRFTHRISRIEWLPAADLLDLHIDTDRPGAHNMVGNSAILLHNSEHVPLLIVDELDVVANPAAYQEAQNIPAGRRNKLPITVLTSTRKQAFGLVQKEIDNQKKSGLKVFHWNIIDVTERCPPERHRPDLPRLPLYVSDDELRHVDESTFNQMGPKEQEGFVPAEGFAGCGSCRLFAACRTRLATHQTSNSLLLKSIPEVIGKFNANTIEMAKAQLLCLKPGSVGLIYGRLDKSRHVLTPAMAYEKIMGEPPPGDPKRFTKAELVLLMKERGLEPRAGLDWGSTHNFAYVQGWKENNRIFITHALAIKGLDPDQMLDVCQPFKEDQAATFADTADPKMIRLFSKYGYNMKKWKKGQGSVVGGINILRWLLNPPGMPPNLFFVIDIDDDPYMTMCINAMAEYHWKKGVDGMPSDVPDEEEDDIPDAVRYLVLNTFTMNGGIMTSANNSPFATVAEGSDLPPPAIAGYDQKLWVHQLVAEKTGDPTAVPRHSRMKIEAPAGSGYSSYYGDNKSDSTTSPFQGEKKKGKRGRLTWNID